MVGRIGLVSNVGGTNFAAFFVTFFDNSLFVVEAKALQIFPKNLICGRIMFSNSDWQNYKYTKETNCIHVTLEYLHCTHTAQDIKARVASAYLWLIYVMALDLLQVLDLSIRAPGKPSEN